MSEPGQARAGSERQEVADVMLEVMLHAAVLPVIPGPPDTPYNTSFVSR